MRDDLRNENFPFLGHEACADGSEFLEHMGREAVGDVAVPKELGSFFAQNGDEAVAEFRRKFCVAFGVVGFSLEKVFRLIEF